LRTIAEDYHPLNRRHVLESVDYGVYAVLELGGRSTLRYQRVVGVEDQGERSRMFCEACGYLVKVLDRGRWDPSHFCG